MKLFAFPSALMPNGGPVELMSQFRVGGVIEVVGGTLLLLGLFTRPIAFLCAGELAVIYWQFHFPQSPWPVTSPPSAPGPSASTRSGVSPLGRWVRAMNRSLALAGRGVGA